jgi:uncharacterized protein (TIGR03067 family)
MSEWWQHSLEPPDPRSAGERDLAALQGVWGQVWSKADGSELDEPPDFPVRVTISGSEFTLSNARLGTAITYRLRPVPGASPKAYDLVDEDDPTQTVEAIYELNGDTLRVCQPLASRPRPTEFNGDEGTMNLLAVHKRVG